MSDDTVIEGSAAGSIVRILSASAQRAALTACAEAFCKHNTGSLHFSWATSGAVINRVESGEQFDLVAASAGALEGLATKGLVDSKIFKAGISRLALGMRKGEVPPDISTVEKFKQALLAASSFSRGDPAGGGTAGNYLVKMLGEIGVLDAIADKSVLRVGGYKVMQEVAEGRADFGLTQSTEIVAVEGVEISAWLPEQLQMDTVYALAPGAGKRTEAASAFLDFVTGPPGTAIYKQSGFAPV